MDRKEKLVPELRFKEFKGEWNNIKLGSLGKFQGGGTPSTQKEEYWKGTTPWISSSDLREDDILILNVSRFLTDTAITESATKIIPANSVLFVSRVGVGKLAVNTVPICTSQDFSNMVIAENSSFYIAYYFLARNKLLHAYSQGTSIKGFTTGDLKSIPIKIPSLPEQQKIADFLSAVDQKIRQLQRKKELLTQYKKGMMQKLFAQEIRFKDEQGNVFPEWEEKKLGEIGDLKNGMNKDKNDFGHGYPFVNLMDVFGKSELYNKEFGLVNSNQKEKKLYDVRKGDVLFIRSSVKRTGVGEAVIIQEDLIDTVYSGFLIRFRENENRLDQSFKQYCFASIPVRKEILSFATSSANTNINQESLNKVRIPVPCVEEQQKIANYLSALDEKGEKVGQQIEKVQEFKKGLLQKMFV